MIGIIKVTIIEIIIDKKEIIEVKEEIEVVEEAEVEEAEMTIIKGNHTKDLIATTIIQILTITTIITTTISTDLEITTITIIITLTTTITIIDQDTITIEMIVIKTIAIIITTHKMKDKNQEVYGMHKEMMITIIERNNKIIISYL